MSLWEFIASVGLSLGIGTVFLSVMCTVGGWLVTRVKRDEPDEYDPLAPPPPYEKGSANDHDLG